MQGAKMRSTILHMRLAQPLNALPSSLNVLNKGGARLFQARAGNFSIGQQRISACAPPQAIASAEEAPARVKAEKSKVSSSTAYSTSLWPCRGGQVVRVIQDSRSGTHTVQVVVDQLSEGQEAELVWGVYRSSPHAWQHPQAIIPAGSVVDEASGAMRSKLLPLSSSQTITLQIPAALAPLTFAFVVALSPSPSTSKLSKKEKFATPISGRHFSVLLGMQAGSPSPLGPSLALPAAGSAAGSAASAPRGGSKKKDTSSPVTINFAMRCQGGTTVSLALLTPPTGSSSEWTCVEFALDPVLNRSGDTWHVAVPGITDLRSVRYGWRVDGDVSWESGYRVQPDRLLLDPMAPAVALLPAGTGPPLPLPEVRTIENGDVALVASALGDLGQSLAVGAPLRRPLEQMLVLEIDVAEFSRGADVSHPGTFLGVAERLDHIKALGVNTLVLSPCYATAQGAAVSFMTPNPSLSSNPLDPGCAATEFLAMVETLHAADVEVILSLDPTLTADGVDAHPTTVSLRGLDNAAYFRPNGVLNCGHPAVAEMLTTALRRWALDFGVDGFCFLNAENMAQDAEGLVVDAPALADSLCHDPILSGIKLIAAPADDSLLPRGGARGFPHWGIWQQRNSRFHCDMTAFIAEGTRGLLDVVALRLTGSADLFEAAWEEDMPGNLAAARRPAFSYNASTAPFGTPLGHLAMEAAGAAAAGAPEVNPPSEVDAMARTMTKSLLLAVILAQGVPVISYADVADLEMARFVGVAMRLRKKLAHLMLPPCFDSPRDITWVGASGGEPDWAGESADGNNYVALRAKRTDGCDVYLGFNPHPHSVAVTLPAPASGSWMVAVDTRAQAPDDAKISDLQAVDGLGYTVSGKSALLLVAGDSLAKRRSK